MKLSENLARVLARVKPENLLVSFGDSPYFCISVHTKEGPAIIIERTVKPSEEKSFKFRSYNIDEVDGTDFWNLTMDEIAYLVGASQEVKND